MNLWIVEDSEADVFLIRESLNHAGLAYRATVAPDGERALSLINGAAVNSDSVQGVILDLNLITHSGFEILRHLRETPGLSAVPVVILTSADSPADRQQAKLLGTLAYFRKPMELDKFMQIGSEIAALFRAASNIAPIV